MDLSMEKKKRLDTARVLISTSSLESISRDTLIKVDDKHVTIHVFEESASDLLNLSSDKIFANKQSRPVLSPPSSSNHTPFLSPTRFSPENSHIPSTFSDNHEHFSDRLSTGIHPLRSPSKHDSCSNSPCSNYRTLKVNLCLENSNDLPSSPRQKNNNHVPLTAVPLVSHSASKPFPTHDSTPNPIPNLDPSPSNIWAVVPFINSPLLSSSSSPVSPITFAKPINTNTLGHFCNKKKARRLSEISPILKPLSLAQAYKPKNKKSSKSTSSRKNFTLFSPPSLNPSLSSPPYNSNSTESFSLTDSGIINRNTILSKKPSFSSLIEAERTWDVADCLGLTLGKCKDDFVGSFDRMVLRDREAIIEDKSSK